MPRDSIGTMLSQQGSLPNVNRPGTARRNRLRLARCVALLWGVLTCTTTVSAQMRIVSYNTPPDGSGLPRSGLDTVLQAIGSESVNGIAKPIDVLLLQEQASPSVTTSALVDLLNGIYGSNIYAQGTVSGGPVWSNLRQGLVYNTQTITLLSEQAFGQTSGTSAQPRQTLRYALRPAGYGDNATFYAYNSHYKAGDEVDNNGNVGLQRLSEAQAIRSNVDALGQGTHAIFAGDFNMDSSSEAAYAHLLSSGNGQTHDPINRPGNWSSNSSFTSVHTQSPVSGSGSNGLIGGGVDDRFDFQLVTGELLDGEGIDYISGSYHAFGNNGTHGCCNNPITAGSGATASVLSALTTASDHLPVVADYQVPAILYAETNTIPTSLALGQTYSLDLTIRNEANVLTAWGADELDFSFSATGAVSGGGSGMDLALGSGQSYALNLDTSSAGQKTGSIVVTTSSPGVPESMVEIPISYTVGSTGGTTVDVPYNLVTQSFELPSSGDYLLDSVVDDGGFHYFNRYALPDTTNAARDDFQTGFDGDYGILGQDPSGAGGSSTVTITLPNIDISGKENLTVSGLFAALDSEPQFNNYEAADGDGIEVFATIDNGAPVLIGAFSPSGTASSLRLDTDLDGTGDGAVLTTDFADFTFPIAGSGSILDLTVAMTSTNSFEPFGVDHLRVDAIESLLLGDYNRDGIVDAADFTVWADNLGDPVTAYGLADGNGNGMIDQDDHAVWVNAFGNVSGMGTRAIPEPSGCGLGLMGLLCVIGLSRRDSQRAAYDAA